MLQLSCWLCCISSVARVVALTAAFAAVLAVAMVVAIAAAIGAAVIAAFVASGLFHEYTLLACFPSHIQAGTPAIGMQTKFMAWNAFIVSMENLVGHFMLFQWMKKNLARGIKVCVLGGNANLSTWNLNDSSTSLPFYALLEPSFILLVAPLLHLNL